MFKTLAGLMTLVAVAGLTSTAQAITDEELAIGVQLIGCISNNGCYSNHGREYNYRHPNYQNNYRHPQYNHPNQYQYKNRSNPQIIIVPARPQYRYTAPYSGYYFDRNQQQFNPNYQNPNHNYQNNYQHPNYQTPYYGSRNQDVRGQINQIYRDVLGRDADFEGLGTYQDRYNNGWSLSDIRRNIANSNEAQNLRRY